MSKKNIEDIYTLSPIQQGMLFHTLFEPDSGVYFDHAINDLEVGARFNLPLFKRAWQTVIDRHPALRTAFAWERRDKPLQLVLRNVRLPLAQLDWREFSPAEQEERLEAFLDEDRRRGFDLSKAPLMRLTLIRMDDTSYKSVWGFHHILMGGLSYVLVLQEVMAVYDALYLGQEIEAKPARPYRDYITWLRKQDLSKAEAYWRGLLKGFTSVTPLVVDTLVDKSFDEDPGYGVLYAWLSEEETAALNSFARQHQITLGTIFQGAWALLLSRYSGERDVMFGLTVSGRPTEIEDVESMIGLFINTLPVRVKIAPSDRVVPWLKKLQLQQADLSRFEYTPLPQLQSWSEIPRGVPLFESVVVFQNMAGGGEFLSFEGASGVRILDSQYISKMNYPLSLVASPGKELKVKANYDRRRLDADSVERMLGHLMTLLNGIAANPEQQPLKLPLMTEAERDQILIEWNDTAKDFPRHLSIHQLFEAQVDLFPDSIAVVSHLNRISYLELDRRSNQLAHFLRSRGVGPDSLVAISLHRGIEMVISILAVLKAGAGYLPLDPSYPRERLDFMMENSRATLLLTQEQLKQSLSFGQAEVICIDTHWDHISRHSTQRCESGVTPSNVAYVIYTSGSTGKPKGILLEHRGLSNLIPEWNEIFGVGRQSKVLQFASFSFDASVWETFSALVAGAELIFGSRETLYSGEEIAQIVREEGVDRALLPPSLLSVLEVEKVRGLARVSAIGEKCVKEVEEKWREGRKFYNAYGPAETTITATVYESQGGGEVRKQGPAIGKGIGNVEVYILDERQEEVPVGVAGEIYIGGEGVGRGYVGDGGKTGEKFVPNEKGRKEGARMYRTGDIGRYLGDGNIEYLGRGDHQVKIRGYRIELGEIESVLRKHPHAKDAVVVAHQVDGAVSEKRLIAYLVAEEGQMSASELRGFVREKLPEYMVPSVFVFLEALPLSPNGKVDRKSLPAPDSSRPELEKAYLAPRNEEEKILAEIWSRVLGVKQVGINDNFFDLGGDSILSIQIIARAGQAGLKLTPKELFQNQTIAELALVAGKSVSNQYEQGAVTGPLPLTPIQAWFFEQEPVDLHHYNQAVLLEAPQTLAPGLLEEAVKRLLLHHDALRLRVVKGESGWQPFIAAPGDKTPFTRLDLSSTPAQELEQRIESEAAKLQAGLSLSGGLMHAALLTLGNDRANRLLIVVHHLAIDGVSWRILLEDFQTVCRDLSEGRKVQLPPKTASFKLWADRLSEYASRGGFNGEIDYWLSVCDADAPRLPVDNPEGVNDVGSTRTVSASLSVEETEALLREVPDVYKTQINDILLAALAQAVGEWTGAESIRLALEGHGREPIFEDVDVSRTVGWFTTMFPVSLHIDGLPDPGDMLKSVKEQLRSMPNKGIGYGALRYLSGDAAIAERLTAAPPAELSFNYFGQFDQTLPVSSIFRVAKESGGPLRSPRGKRAFLLEVNCFVGDGRLQVVWSYSENLHHRMTIESLARKFTGALQGIISHCQSPEAGGYTPSDFPDVDLDQEKLEKALAEMEID